MIHVIQFKPTPTRLTTVLRSPVGIVCELRARGFLHCANDLLCTAFWQSPITNQYAISIGYDDELSKLEGDWPQEVIASLTDETPFFSTSVERLDSSLLATPRLV